MLPDRKWILKRKKKRKDKTDDHYTWTSAERIPAGNKKRNLP